MITDQYANYFCPKLFCALESEDRLRFLSILRPYCVMIARSKVGTYPLQIIIESIKGVDESLIMIDAFKKDILDICFVILSFIILYYKFIFYYIII